MRFILLLFLIVIVGCSSGPEPLAYGKDGCHHCKMTLMDRKFGAEIVTAKGKVFKFDDVNCMINYINANITDEREIVHKLVVEFSEQEKLVDAGSAFFVKSEEIRSPMNSQVAAFEDYEKMKAFKETVSGIYLTWGELITQYK